MAGLDTALELVKEAAAEADRVMREGAAGGGAAGAGGEEGAEPALTNGIDMEQEETKAEPEDAAAQVATAVPEGSHLETEEGGAEMSQAADAGRVEEVQQVPEVPQDAPQVTASGEMAAAQGDDAVMQDQTGRLSHEPEQQHDEQLDDGSVQATAEGDGVGGEGGVAPQVLQEGPSFQLPPGALTAFKDGLSMMSSILTAALLPLLGPSAAQQEGEQELRQLWRHLVFHISALAEGALGSDVSSGAGAVYEATHELMVAALVAHEEPGSLQEMAKKASDTLTAKVAAVVQATAQGDGSGAGQGQQGDAADRGGGEEGVAATQPPAGRVATRRTTRAKQEAPAGTQ
jgi:hypothetical protein